MPKLPDCYSKACKTNEPQSFHEPAHRSKSDDTGRKERIMDLFDFLKDVKDIAFDAISQTFDQAIDLLQREFDGACNQTQQNNCSASQPQKTVTPAPVPAPVPQPVPCAAPETRNEQADEQYDMELTKQIIERFRVDTQKPVLRIKLTDAELKLCDSKIGGLPYLPADAEVPLDGKGGALRLLAQIDCTQLSDLPEFPQTGLLQFWIAQNPEWGLFQENGHRVIWYETVDADVTAEQVQAKLDAAPKPEDFDETFPINGAFGIEFCPEQECIAACNSQFVPLFTEKFNELCPDSPIEHPGQLGDEIGEMMWEELSGDGNKIGGYPAFTQGDPRSEDDKRTVLLLQLDSAAQDGYPIMWGDVGIANFFCTPEELKARNFSNVLYNWDCG